MKKALSLLVPAFLFAAFFYLFLPKDSLFYYVEKKAGGPFFYQKEVLDRGLWLEIRGAEFSGGKFDRAVIVPFAVWIKGLRTDLSPRKYDSVVIFVDPFSMRAKVRGDVRGTIDLEKKELTLENGTSFSL